MYIVLMPELKQNPVKYQNFFRMEIATFQKLTDLLSAEFDKTNINNNGRLICLEERLMVTLR